MTARALSRAAGGTLATNVHTVTLLRGLRKRLAPAYARALEEAWRRLPAAADELWRQAIILGRVDPLLPLIAELGPAVGGLNLQALEQAFLAGGKVAAKDLAKALGLTGLFALPHEAAAAWAREHGGRLVVGMTQVQADAFRALLAEAMMGRYTPAELARRTKDLWGMTAQQTRWIEKHQQRLDRLVERGKLTRERADKAHGRYVDKLRRMRARLIAEHQVVWGLNAGQEAMWATAVSKGFLDKTTTWRTWIITPDELLCEYCQVMAGQKVRLGVPWLHPVTNQVLMTPQESHPRCRCTEGLVFQAAKVPGKAPKPVPKPKPVVPALVPTPKPKPPAPTPKPVTPEEQVAELEQKLRAPTEWKPQATIADIRKETQKRWGIAVYEDGALRQADAVMRLNEAMEELERMTRITGRHARLKAVLLGGLDAEPQTGGLFTNIKQEIKLARRLVMHRPKKVATQLTTTNPVWNIDFMAHHSVMRHEYGHAMHATLITAEPGSAEAALGQAWTALYESVETAWWRRKVSGYAKTNEREAFAESWAAYSSEKYVEGALPEEVVAFFRKLILLWGGA
jgi:hypothetical protein